MSKRQQGLKRKAATDSQLKAKRAKGETDLADNLKWSQPEPPLKGACPPLIVLSSDTLPGATKVAAFDIDWTIIKTASGKKFATGAKDWKFWDKCVPEKLRQLSKDGYRIIFFTNQAGIEKLKVTPQEFMSKSEAIISGVGVPIMVFASTGVNHFRKPSTTMWDYFEKNLNKGVKVDRSKSLYVGDAAGRAKDWAPGKPKDFSCTDRMYAANLGVEFSTPEEYFLGESPAKFSWRSIDPVAFLAKASPPTKTDYHSTKQEVVIMVGCPASGKSTFRRRYLEPKGYIAVNRDTMGTMAKCIKAATEALGNGKSVVADNTNPSESARADFIGLAEKKGVPCRCIWMKTSVEFSHHLNQVRQNQTKGEIRRVPDVGFNMFKKNFQPPTKAEGFTEILELDFKPKFDNDRDEKLFKEWTDV